MLDPVTLTAIPEAHSYVQQMNIRSAHYGAVLADPPWRFVNRTGKMAPEHRRISRYPTMTVEEISGLPVSTMVRETAHCYLWIPNALLPQGLQVPAAGA